MLIKILLFAWLYICFLLHHINIYKISPLPQIRQQGKFSWQFTKVKFKYQDNLVGNLFHSSIAKERSDLFFELFVHMERAIQNIYYSLFHKTIELNHKYNIYSESLINDVINTFWMYPLTKIQLFWSLKINNCLMKSHYIHLKSIILKKCLKYYY